MVAVRPASATASSVLRPSPVLIATVSVDGSSSPFSTSFLSTPTVTPPAVSAKMPSVRASSRIASTDLVVGDVLDRAAGAAGDVQHVRAVGRVADRQRLGDGVRLDRADHVVAGLEGRETGEQPARLGAEDPCTASVLDQAEPDQLLQALVDLGELRARRRSG